MAKINQSNLLLNYENKWVAVSPDWKNVVVAADTYKAAVKKLDLLKDDDAILTKVLPFGKSYSPLHHG